MDPVRGGVNGRAAAVATSELGQNRKSSPTLSHVRSTSEADVGAASPHVGFGPTTDVDVSPDYPVGEREAPWVVCSAPLCEGPHRSLRCWSSDTSAPRDKKRGSRRGVE